ncbi:MAG: pinensin family lanthipeptide [Acidobacteriota bacterium]|nr:pinensin family lanthipeptide [Acidobacteriota bacterium]
MKKLNLDQLKVNSFVTKGNQIAGGKRGNCFGVIQTQQCYTQACGTGLDDGIPNRL